MTVVAAIDPSTDVVARPWVKRAGGKARTLPILREVLREPFGLYHEPFVGGGAAFWDLAQRASSSPTERSVTLDAPDGTTREAFAHSRGMRRASSPVKRFHIADSDSHLMRAYRVIRDDVHELVEISRRYPPERDAALYYRERDLYNLDAAGDSEATRVARYLYLSASAFNGLWRVNKRGFFNTPFGAYESPLRFDETNLIACSRVLRKAVISCAGFETSFRGTQPGDLVYCDPPYVPTRTGRKETGEEEHGVAAGGVRSFTGYGQDGFSGEDQARLRDLAVDAVRRGVRIVLSNSVAAMPLYDNRDGAAAGLEVSVVQNTRSIAAAGDRRGPCDELLITGGF